MIVNPVFFHAIAFFGTAFVLVGPDPQQLGSWAVFAAITGSIITNYINRRFDQKERDRQRDAEKREREQRHQWDVEALNAHARQVKHELEDAKRVVAAKTDAIRDDLAANTAITLQAAQKADAAYDAANHVDERIGAAIAKTQGPIKDIAIDTNDTAHRIEGKL